MLVVQTAYAPDIEVRVARVLAPDEEVGAEVRLCVGTYELTLYTSSTEGVVRMRELFARVVRELDAITHDGGEADGNIRTQCMGPRAG